MYYDPSKVVQVARNEIGYLEKKTVSNLDSKTGNAGSLNYTKYARDLDALGFYNGKKNGVAWCDVFVDWCFVQAYGLEAAAKMTFQTPGKNNAGAGCTYSRQYYKNSKHFFSEPQVGDQIFFYPSSGIGGATMSHTGLVVDVDGDYVYTVEGNTSGANGVVANGGGVCNKKYKKTYARIAGYGRPDWGTKERAKSMFEKGTKIATVTADTANARVGDSAKYASAGYVKKGEVYEWVATSTTGWHAIRMKDGIRWVSPKYLKLGTV